MDNREIPPLTEKIVLTFECVGDPATGSYLVRGGEPWVADTGTNHQICAMISYSLAQLSRSQNDNSRPDR